MSRNGYFKTHIGIFNITTDYTVAIRVFGRELCAMSHYIPISYGLIQLAEITFGSFIIPHRSMADIIMAYDVYRQFLLDYNSILFNF